MMPPLVGTSLLVWLNNLLSFLPVTGILCGVRPSRWIFHHRHQLRRWYDLRCVAREPTRWHQRTGTRGSWDGRVRPPNDNDRRRWVYMVPCGRGCVWSLWKNLITRLCQMRAMVSRQVEVEYLSHVGSLKHVRGATKFIVASQRMPP